MKIQFILTTFNKTLLILVGVGCYKIFLVRLFPFIEDKLLTFVDWSLVDLRTNQSLGHLVPSSIKQLMDRREYLSTSSYCDPNILPSLYGNAGIFQCPVLDFLKGLRKPLNILFSKTSLLLPVKVKESF